MCIYIYISIQWFSHLRLLLCTVIIYSGRGSLGQWGNRHSQTSFIINPDQYWPRTSELINARGVPRYRVSSCMRHGIQRLKRSFKNSELKKQVARMKTEHMEIRVVSLHYVISSTHRTVKISRLYKILTVSTWFWNLSCANLLSFLHVVVGAVVGVIAVLCRTRYGAHDRPAATDHPIFLCICAFNTSAETYFAICKVFCVAHICCLL